ncbi:MAG: hypothetical protein ABMA02_10970 [Saprospiraceae bacterium]
MNFFKNFAPLATLAFAAILFAAPQAHAQSTSGTFVIRLDVEPSAAAYIKFDGVDGECTVKEGRNIVGTNTRTNEKLMIVVKSGKLTQFGTQAVGGKFKALTPTATPCSTIHCTTLNPPRCFIYNGSCICVCGPWITAAGGN